LKTSNAGFFTSIYRMVRINYKERTFRGSSYFAKATKDKLPSLELPGGIFYMDGYGYTG
jgi:hypothetical protein